MNDEAHGMPEVIEASVERMSLAEPSTDPSTEVVLLVRPLPPDPDPGPDPVTQAVALVAAVAGRARAVGEQAARSATSAVLDRTVPVLVQAVLDRVDLTQLILDRVDVDRVVAQANLEEIIDRLPLVDLANYVIDEINLPQIVRESTGGIASDAVNMLRMQSIDVDQVMNRVSEILLRRRPTSQPDAGTGAFQPPAAGPDSSSSGGTG